jgi:hypothetical protein
MVWASPAPTNIVAIDMHVMLSLLQTTKHNVSSRFLTDALTDNPKIIVLNVIRAFNELGLPY